MESASRQAIQEIRDSAKGIIVVIPAERATTEARHLKHKKGWVVEGDFGFMADFKTRREAINFAKEEVEGAKLMGDNIEWTIDE